MAGSARRLWRGDPFPDLIDDDYARGTVEALGEIRLRTETRWLDALLASGRVEEVLPELERLVTEFPYEERFWERLMLARYRIGNTAGALRAFQTFRGLLGDELGVEPGASLPDAGGEDPAARSVSRTCQSSTGPAQPASVEDEFRGPGRRCRCHRASSRGSPSGHRDRRARSGQDQAGVGGGAPDDLGDARWRVARPARGRYLRT